LLRGHHAQLSSKLDDLLLVIGRKRCICVHRVRDDVDLRGRAGEVSDQELSSMLRTDNNGVWQLIDILLKPQHWSAQDAICRQKSVVHHLSGEAALEVEDQRYTPQSAQRVADQCTLMEMGMDDVWPLP
jgi:hypothetical protein